MRTLLVTLLCLTGAASQAFALETQPQLPSAPRQLMLPKSAFDLRLPPLKIVPAPNGGGLLLRPATGGEQNQERGVSLGVKNTACDNCPHGIVEPHFTFGPLIRF